MHTHILTHTMLAVDLVAVSVEDEIFVKGNAHLDSPVVPKVEHRGRVLFPPVLPPVSLDHPLVHLAILVSVLPCGRPHTISMKAREFWNIVPSIFLIDC